MADNLEQIDIKINKTIDWLREKVKNSGTNGLIVGVSGGVDSALVACLIKKAFPDNSLGVILPIENSSEDIIHARDFVNSIDIKNIEIDISKEFNSIYSGVSGLICENYNNDYPLELSKGNLKARLRMSTLYTFANILNYLVVGTDNKAELYTGYFTKYGDGGVDILPIASLTKSEVFTWAKHLGVDEKIINKAPSAGLWEGQTDEKELGVTYETIDKYLKGEEISNFDKEIIEGHNRKSKHKRTMPEMFNL